MGIDLEEERRVVGGLEFNSAYIRRKRFPISILSDRGKESFCVDEERITIR